MATISEALAERRIAEAVLRGDLDGLPGAGKPLEFADDPLVAPEQRMVNRILKNAGFTPREIVLRKKIAALRREIASVNGGERREQLKRELALLLIQLCERGGVIGRRYGCSRPSRDIRRLAGSAAGL